MDFVLWACRVMHAVSAVVWIGGLIFMNAVLHPILQHQGLITSQVSMAVSRRFLPFVWFCLWSMVVTGLLLMLLNPRFLWFDFSTDWSKLLAAKQILFLLLAGVSWQAAKVVAKLETAVRDGSDEVEGWSLALQKLVRRSILFGLLSILCAAGMAVL
ncbi:MAG TPA: hypothetical protein VJB38_15295 [Bacteroidota bacterium]|nr:hypothetical protein [Bacteroidota bacterium]